MNIDINVVYIVILIFIATNLLLIGIIASYIKLMNKYINLKEGKEENIDPRTLLAKASLRSQKILEDAHIKAREIVGSAELYKNVNNQKIKEELEKSNGLYIKFYQDSLNKLQQESINKIQNIPEYVKTLMIKEISGISLNIKTEIQKVQIDAINLIRNAYTTAENEVEKYKKIRLEQVDERIIEILQEVSRKVLSREINIDEHEKLVIKALEEAKRQHVFSTDEKIEKNNYLETK